jgi:hypothetical protein
MRGLTERGASRGRAARAGREPDQQPGFVDPRNYGYRKPSDPVEATGLFEVRRSDLVVLVRDKPAT